MSPTESAPPETALHHVRNVLQAFEQPAREKIGGIVCDTTFTAIEAAAIVARLRAIQRELEAPPFPSAPITLRIDDAIHLRAVGDHVERVYPEAASAADESDPDDHLMGCTAFVGRPCICAQIRLERAHRESPLPHA